MTENAGDEITLDQRFKLEQLTRELNACDDIAKIREMCVDVMKLYFRREAVIRKLMEEDMKNKIISILK